MAKITSHFITVEGIRLHCLVAEPAPDREQHDPVVLLHGWPTNAQLWRHVLQQLGEHRRVIAIDLPGSGQSDKPTDVRYSFPYYGRILDGALDALGITTLGLGVHDLGGPVGMHWATQNLDRVSSLALLNTLVFPEMSWAVKAFMAGLHLPGVRGLMTSPWGIAKAMQLGVIDRDRLTPDVIAHYDRHHPTAADRKALIMTATGLHPKGFETIGAALPKLNVPVRVIYGERDRILPDVAQTMARVVEAIPHAEVTSLPNVGHFLQEDAPDEVAQLLTDFFRQPPASSRQQAQAT